MSGLPPEKAAEEPAAWRKFELMSGFASDTRIRARAIAVSAAVLLLIVGVGCSVISSVAQGRAAAQPADVAQLRTIRDVALPGDTSRFDYESIDPQAHRLYIAHLGAGSVLAYDTEQRQVIAEIPGVAGVHGVIAVPELSRVYATATSSREIAVIDTASLSVVATAQGDGYPDGLAYAPNVGKVYVSDEQDGNETVIDVQSNQRLGAIALGGAAGNTQYDPLSGHIYVALQTRNQVVVVDPMTDQVIERYDTPGCDEPHGLLLDADQQRAFVACQGNAKLIVMTMPNMQVTSTQDVGNNPDVLALDPGLHFVYVAAEAGSLAVFREEDSGAVTRIAFQTAGPNAHVVAVDPATHSIYIPLANLNGHPVLRELTVEVPANN
jgi:DNA-binding beta-propeller fold protein YncE